MNVPPTRDDQLAPPSAGQPVTQSERQRLLPPGEARLLTAGVVCSPF